MVYRLGKATGLNEQLDAVPGLHARRRARSFSTRSSSPSNSPRVLGPAGYFWSFFGMAVLLTGGIIFENTNWAAKANPYKPPVEKPAENVTGDSQFDRLLADLENPAKAQGAADKLAKMKPDENRARVAAKLAVLTDAGQNNFVRKAAIIALGVWATPQEIPALGPLFRGLRLTRGGGDRPARGRSRGRGGGTAAAQTARGRRLAVP